MKYRILESVGLETKNLSDWNCKMCRIAELLRPDKAGGKNELIENIDKVHTTEMGIDRIRRNLGLGDVDAAAWCKSRILDKNADITRQGKNWYVRTDGCVITVNASCYTIITAHESVQ